MDPLKRERGCQGVGSGRWHEYQRGRDRFGGDQGTFCRERGQDSECPRLRGYELLARYKEETSRRS